MSDGEPGAGPRVAKRQRTNQVLASPISPEGVVSPPPAAAAPGAADGWRTKLTAAVASGNGGGAAAIDGISAPVSDSGPHISLCADDEATASEETESMDNTAINSLDPARLEAAAAAAAANGASSAAGTGPTSANGSGAAGASDSDDGGGWHVKHAGAASSALPPRKRPQRVDGLNLGGSLLASRAGAPALPPRAPPPQAPLGGLRRNVDADDRRINLERMRQERLAAMQGEQESRSARMERQRQQQRQQAALGGGVDDSSGGRRSQRLAHQHELQAQYTAQQPGHEEVEEEQGDEADLLLQQCEEVGWGCCGVGMCRQLSEGFVASAATAEGWA